MAGSKLIVIYPRPKDVEAFEHVYQKEHAPLAVAKLGGKTKIVATKVVGSPQGIPPFYRIAEAHFPSLQALQACATSEGGKQALAHAVSISSAGFPGSGGRDLYLHRDRQGLGPGVLPPG